MLDLDMEIKEQHKQKFFLLLVASTAFILAYGIWNNYRPTIVLAGCSEIAMKTSTVSTRTSLPGDASNDFDLLLNDCLSQSGI